MVREGFLPNAVLPMSPEALLEAFGSLWAAADFAYFRPVYLRPERGFRTGSMVLGRALGTSTIGQPS